MNARRSTWQEPDIGMTEYDVECADDTCPDCQVLPPLATTHTGWGVMFVTAALFLFIGIVAGILIRGLFP